MFSFVPNGVETKVLPCYVRPSVMEPLERRKLMASVALNETTHVLTVNGDWDLRNWIDVSQVTLTVPFSGTFVKVAVCEWLNTPGFNGCGASGQYFNASSVTLIRIAGGYYDDHVTQTAPKTNQIDGGPGNDTLAGGDGETAGNDGSDVIQAGGTIWGDYDLFGLGVPDQSDGSDTIYGGGGDDTIRGGGANDFIHAGSGNDVAYGDADDDWIVGGYGDDMVIGGVGNDYLDALIPNAYAGTLGSEQGYGFAMGDDVLLGGEGHDVLGGAELPFDPDPPFDVGGPVPWDGADHMEGGEGNDTLYGADHFSDLLYGGYGVDVYTWNSSDIRADPDQTL
jgi:hypothetical protein